MGAGLAFVPSRNVAPGALGATEGAAAVSGKPVKLLPGQGLHFTPGKGVHTGPAAPGAATEAAPPPTDPYQFTPPPTTPLMTAKQVAADAANQANLNIRGQVAPFQSDLAQTAASGELQQQQAGLFSSAAGKLLGSIGPSIQQGLDTAANESAGLAKGIEGPVQQELGSTQDANAALAAQWGANPGQGPTTVDPTALGNTGYMGGGFIPSNQLITNAQAQNQWAAGLKGVEASQGMADQQSIGQATQSAEGKINDKIAQVIAKYPQLFTAAEHADITNNLKQAGINVDAYKAAESAAYHRGALMVDSAKVAAQIQHLGNEDTTAAKVAYGKLVHWTNADNAAATKINNDAAAKRAALKVKIQGINATISFHNGELKLRSAANATAAQRADTAWLQEQTKAHGINYGASKVAGVLMLNNGQPAYTKGHKLVPIDPRAYGSAGNPKGKPLTSTQLKNSPQGQQSSASTWAQKEYSKPNPAPHDLQIIGKYILDPGLKYDPTKGDKKAGALILTSDETRAQRGSTLTFAQAVAHIRSTWPKVTKAQARKLLRGIGIKPDGNRSGGSYAAGQGPIAALTGGGAPTPTTTTPTAAVP